MVNPASGFYCLFDATVEFGAAQGALVAPTAISPTHRVGVWQPPHAELAGFANGSDERHVLFHGHLHNRAALLAVLDLPPSTATETLLLTLWQRWPRDWANRLDGHFALVYWQGVDTLCTLHRDASGAFGLFHARTASGGLAISSHLDTLLRLPGVERRIARRGLHEYLRLLDIAAPNTLYEGVRAIPPGEGLELSCSRPGVERLLTRPTPEPCTASFEAGVTAFEAAFAASVGACLDGARRPAAFLSGGIDSALVCALGSRQRPDLLAVTVGFKSEHLDETPVAQRIAAHLGLQHTVLRFGQDELTSALIRCEHHAEQPVADPVGPTTLLVYERIRVEHDRILDGSGADELVGAMPPRHVRVATGYAAVLPHSVRQALIRLLRRLPGVSAYAPIFDFEHPAEMLMRWNGFHRAEIETLCGEAVDLTDTRFMRTFARFARGQHYARQTALYEAMPNDRLVQAALITGLDTRYPFWAQPVADCLRAQPMAHLWKDGESKRILRAALARYVPRSTWEGPKHSFDFPLLEFLRAEDFRLVRQYLVEQDRIAWPGLSPTVVADYGRRFIAGERKLTFRIWALIVLGVWFEAHGI